jgi:hypothetical protein
VTAVTARTEDLPAPTPVAARLQQIVGAASGAIGLVYALGALARLGELIRGGVDVTVAFPIIPVEQHLARGVQILLQPAGLLYLAILIAAALVYQTLLEPPQPAGGKGEGRLGSVKGWLRANPRLAAAAFVLVFAVVLVVRPLVAAQWLVGTAVMLCSLALIRLRTGGAVAVTTRVLLILFGAVCGLVFRGYVAPLPLDRVEVTVEGHAPVNGRFVAVVDNSWYLQGGTGVLEEVGDKHAVAARVTHVPRHGWSEKTLPGILSDL